MKVRGDSVFVILEADEGFIFVDGESGVGSYSLYLGLRENPQTFKEVPVEEYFGPEVTTQSMLADELADIFNEEVNK